MVNLNRQCFFFTENRPQNRGELKTYLPWKNTRMYMNRMVVAEADQFEISGFFPINSPIRKRNKRNGRNFTKTDQDEDIREIIDKLSGASGTVHLFISGINLTDRLYLITEMVRKFYRIMFYL